MLTSPGCHWCADAEALLARLGEEFDLHVTTRPVETEDGRVLALAHGALFPPVVFVNGTFAQYGRPSERRLRAALQAAGARARQEAR